MELVELQAVGRDVVNGIMVEAAPQDRRRAMGLDARAFGGFLPAQPLDLAGGTSRIRQRPVWDGPLLFARGVAGCEDQRLPARQDFWPTALRCSNTSRCATVASASWASVHDVEVPIGVALGQERQDGTLQ